MEYLGHSFKRNVSLYSFRASSWAYFMAQGKETLYNISKYYICKTCQVLVIISNNKNPQNYINGNYINGSNFEKLLSCNEHVIKKLLE